MHINTVLLITQFNWCCDKEPKKGSMFIVAKVGVPGGSDI